MATASTMSLLPISHLKQLQQQRRVRRAGAAAGPLLVLSRRRRHVVPRARLFGPAIFEASKLKVLFVGVDEEKHPGKLPRTYTLTHSDVTARLTLAVSHTIHAAQLQGWYNRLQRDEVVAEWKKVRGAMSLHVHCHISGGHFLLDLIAPLRYYIFRKELPVVLKAFVHGDGSLFSQHPELEEATVWVYFHSNNPNFNRVECWGPLRDAAAPYDDETATATADNPAAAATSMAAEEQASEWPRRCPGQCECCFPPECLIPWPQERDMAAGSGGSRPQAGGARARGVENISFVDCSTVEHCLPLFDTVPTKGPGAHGWAASAAGRRPDTAAVTPAGHSRIRRYIHTYTDGCQAARARSHCVRCAIL